MHGSAGTARFTRPVLCGLVAAVLALAGLPLPAQAKASPRIAPSSPVVAPPVPRMQNLLHPRRAHRLDADHDGLSNWTEVKRTRTNPHKADTDGDGLSDWTEVRRTRTNPRRADSDGDGVSDGAEIVARSNPWDPMSRPGLPRPPEGEPGPPQPEEPGEEAGPPSPGEPTKAIWAAPAGAQVGFPVTLNGTGSTGGLPLTCTWSFEDSGKAVFDERVGCMIDFTFDESGTKYVRLTVQGVGGEDSNKKSFEVTNAETEPPPDTTPPDTTISSGPPATTTSTSADLSFSSSEPGSSFACTLDSGAFASCSSPKSYSGLSVGSHTFSVRAMDAAGNTDSSPATRTWTIEEEEAPPPAGSHCFSSPHTCGYPDATNTGVPPGTTLTSSGSITASTPGQVINARDVTGTINVVANNVTIQNTRVTLTGPGCGTANTCGNYEIRIDEGVTGTVIRNSEVLAAPGTTCEHDIRNTSGPSLQIIGVYMHGCDSNLYGGGTMTDSYGIAKIAISTDHVENIYFDDTAFTANHDTLLNPIDQTAVIFGNSNGGTDTTNCTNHLTVTNSLLAGGGYTFYPCAHSSQAGSSSLNIQNNHFARCTTSEVYNPNGGTHTCSGGADANGYYPHSGAFGMATDYFSGTGTWKGNVWDDNLAPVCINGNAGCG